MHFSAIVSLLAATGALAAPLAARSDNTVRVSLSDLQETGAQVTLQEGFRNTAAPSTKGPFATVELTLGPDVKQQNLRCQILNKRGNPITLKRGENIDTTFGDGGKGPWTIQSDSLTKVSQVICDPAFVSANAPPAAPPAAEDPQDLSLRVILQNQATETGSQTVLTAGQRQASSPVATKGPFQTVELNVGADVDAAYRCQIQDLAGNPLVVLRGGNREITFGDGGKGPWTLESGTSSVGNIVCDPTFVKSA